MPALINESLRSASALARAQRSRARIMAERVSRVGTAGS
jgi:hypothetical protein